MPACFLDCEFTDLLHPELLSTWMVDLAEAEHYVELLEGHLIGNG